MLGNKSWEYMVGGIMGGEGRMKKLPVFTFKGKERRDLPLSFFPRTSPETVCGH
jgi:hypothetical protein